MQIKKLREVVALITAVPSRLLMELPLVTDAKHDKNDATTLVHAYMKGHPIPECNTVGCMAGWTVVRYAPKQLALIGNEDGTQKKWGPIRAAAIKILDLTLQQADALFHVSNWEPLYRDMYRDAKSSRKRARALQLQAEYVISHRKELA